MEILLNNFITPAVSFLIPVILFNIKHKPRKLFFIRLFIFYLILVGASFIPINSLTQNAGLCIFLKAIYFFFIASIQIFATFLLYKIGKIHAVILGVSAYALEHLAHDAMYFLALVFKFYPYNWVKYPVAAVIYLLAYVIFIRKQSSNEPTFDLKWILISIFLLSFCIILNLFTLNTAVYEQSTVLCFLYDFIGTFISIILLFYKAANNSLELELKKHNEMWKLKKEYYKMSTENIEILNQKCHDLRHKIIAIQAGATNSTSNKIIKELEDTIMLYDITANTGNKALDTIITEKSLYCNKHGIRFKFMADGKKLDFIDSLDIFAIFGNALENAIESVSKIENADKKIINLNVSAYEKLLTIQVDNFFNEQITFKDGLPQSTKGNNAIHGFGVKSIKMLSQKYGGDIKITITEDLFTLLILIPIP